MSPLALHLRGNWDTPCVHMVGHETAERACLVGTLHEGATRHGVSPSDPASVCPLCCVSGAHRGGCRERQGSFSPMAAWHPVV